MGVILQPAVLSILCSFIITAQAQGMSSTRLDGLQLCPGISQEIIFFARPKNFNRGRQLVDFNLTLPYPVAENMLMKIQLEKEAPMVKDAWLPLIDFEIKEGACVAIDKYVGELAYDMERAIGLAPRTCPLPKGVYHANDFTMDYGKLKLPIMPSGRTRVRVELYHKQRKQSIACQLVTLSAL